MFTFRKCSVPDCRRSALTGREVCATHCGDLHAYEKQIAELLSSQKRLTDYDISGISLSDVEVEGVTVSGCNLQGVRCGRLVLKAANFQLVFCDGAEFRECNLDGSTVVNSVFAGSVFDGCSFSNCDLLQCNFMGAQCRDTVFDHSNLYAGRFLKAAFQNVNMRDCNVMRVRFDAKVTGVDFHASNTNEATFMEAGQ